MARRYRRKCRHCKKFFVPDPRNAKRQRYCREDPCRAASKTASQRRWLGKPENRDVFKGPEHVARVQRWRRSHPGYWRHSSPRGSSEPTALQDSLITQVVDNHEESGHFVEPALQDLLGAQATVLIGLIAQFSGSALQDDIAEVGHRLLRLGQDVLHGGVLKEGDIYDSQAPDLPRTGPPPPPPVQLD